MKSNKKQTSKQVDMSSLKLESHRKTSRNARAPDFSTLAS
jgi:hypothetical protein